MKMKLGYARLICIGKKKDKASPVKTGKSYFFAFFVLAAQVLPFICEMSYFVTVANQEIIFLAIHASYASCLQVNSTCYPEFRFSLF